MEAYCREEGGHLVSISDAKEQSFLSSILPEKDRRNCYWIGLYYDSEWKWSDGSEVTFTNWAYNEPNNYHSEGESYAHICGNLYTAGNRKEIGKWNDTANDGAGYANEYFDLSNYGFICEWENTEDPIPAPEPEPEPEIELKDSVITASASELKAKKLKKKAQTVDIQIEGSDGAVTIENLTDEFLAKKVKINGTEITFKKKAKKGTYSFKVTVAGNEEYKETTETITIMVK